MKSSVLFVLNSCKLGWLTLTSQESSKVFVLMNC